MNETTRILIREKGEAVFHKKRITCSYDTLIKGVALGPNTYRAFHKKDKGGEGAKVFFENFLSRSKEFITKQLPLVNSEDDLMNIKDELALRLKDELLKNIRSSQLNSFNKLHKPIDIVLEHLIAMGCDFQASKRQVSKHLFLPLDSQIFSSKIVFSDEECRELRIKRSFTFKDVTNRTHYMEIQTFLKEKARILRIGDRIFFDLVWSNRYMEKNTDIFAL